MTKKEIENLGFTQLEFLSFLISKGFKTFGELKNLF